MVLEEAEDGSVSSHSLNTAASQRLSVSDFSPAMARKAIAQHSAWRYAKALECLLDAESRSKSSDKDHIRGQLDLSGESGSNVLSPFIESA
jgi:predicted alpha-1,6-mannanase (GH76 family)